MQIFSFSKIHLVSRGLSSQWVMQRKVLLGAKFSRNFFIAFATTIYSMFMRKSIALITINAMSMFSSGEISLLISSTHSAIGKSGSASPGMSKTLTFFFVVKSPRAQFFSELTTFVSPPWVLSDALKWPESLPSSKKLQTVDFPAPGPPKGMIVKCF